MTEHPILFRTEMVRAILDGRKSVTRRMVRPQPTYTDMRGRLPLELLNERLVPLRCPYGAAGDRLWVREPWAPGFAADDEVGGDPERTIYRATVRGPEPQRWRSSIHMPQSRSRLSVDVLSVRVERVQSITEEDAAEEGIGPRDMAYRVGFIDAWRGMHGPAAWADNPWIWRVKFRRVQR